uniref:Kinesin motor domain-containing protein n=1 Tax=Pseudo-nitzschia multistriata TaxID=183589 RepID=A0A448ZFH2_9STRA
MGGGMSNAMMQEETHQGVLPRAIRNIFDELQTQQQQVSDTRSKPRNNVRNDTGASCTSYEFSVRVQFLEIYGEEIRDLLNPRPVGTSTTESKLSIRDVGNEEPEVVGATMHKVDSAEEALLCLTSGMYRRVTASTAMNAGSSRSHAILSLIVEQSTSMDEIEQNTQSKTSRFNFVDLAGSERQKRTQATGQRLKEGIDINKGLLVLGNVISALGDPQKRGKTFVPYRDSKLTRLLKGSLGGNHKTLMIACVSPSSSNMDETLNCLRYANRAKNIQNHAVVNLDAASLLVAELRGKIQGLARDLIKAKTGKLDECSIPMNIVESLASGGDGAGGGKIFTKNIQPAFSASATDNESKAETQRLRAENESIRLQLHSFSEGNDPSEVLQEAYVTKVTEYEKEISRLKHEIQAKNDTKSTLPIQPESPELNRLRSQMFGSLAKSITLDAEVEAEEEAMKNLSEKFLNHPMTDGEFPEYDRSHDMEDETASTPAEVPAALDADLFALSNSISAKESLIHQLQASQEKFESMREFYEEKLREMGDIVAEKEADTEKLVDELKKLGDGHSRGKELSQKLKEKQAQVVELKRKQAELSRLTNVASRNESQIARLKNDVQEMKHKKIDLQKQMVAERKNHMSEVKKMKKESLQKDRELNKAKREVNKKSQEASKAQKIAKVRLGQMNQLKAKYKDTEKRLRMKTVKQGVLKKAGLEPVLFGRSQARDDGGKKHRTTAASKWGKADVDKLRDFFDKKVADVSRRENLAEKLAQEWEEHLELTIQKEESFKTDPDDQHESIQALDSAIKYREERIRQLASKLGKRDKKNKHDPANDETFVFKKEFTTIVGSETLTGGAETVAKVLFGMVVRERRRIASLARTASSLDEKVQEIEAALAEKDAAFNAYVGEQRLDAAALAQNQQEHILSLMEMVKEGQTEESQKPLSPRTDTTNRRLSLSAKDGNSRLLVLANGRIEVLERQLSETLLARDAVRKHQEREQSALFELDAKTKECEELLEEIDELRSALRRIREQVVDDESRSAVGLEKERQTPSKAVEDIVTLALHPASLSSSNTRRRRSVAQSMKRQSLVVSTREKENELLSSDSDEVPDWAEDIMADLAIIADGKMPASLMQSQEVIEAEANNVFDRLTNPKGFTGVQKQRSVTRSRTMRKNQTSDGLKSSTFVDEKERKKEGAPLRRQKEKISSESAGNGRTVFDRLLSPSNLTGTQKQKFHRIHDKKGRTLEKAIENQHVSVRGRSRAIHYDSDHTEDEKDFVLHDQFSPKSKGSDAGEKRNSHNSSKVDDHSQLSVFERLNKTTTQAYKEKVHGNIAEKMLDDILLDEEEHENDDDDNDDESHKFEPRTKRIKEYASQDVFERLQRTTTEAYASKQNHPTEDSSVPRSPSPMRRRGA